MKTSYPNSTGWCLTVLALISISSTANAQTLGEFTPSTSTAIWNAYVANPNADDHIPNNSFAGYRQGVVPLPQIPQVVDVTNYGAVGDGVTDNSEAFRQAISAAYGMGGGAVYVPAGTYATEDPIWLRYDNVVLRGAGKGVTNIKFTRSLVDSVGNVNPNSTNIWSWSGGQIWVGPNDKAVFSDDADDAELRVDTRDSQQDYSSSSNPWEYWRLTNEVTTVTDVNARGDNTITVGNAASFKPGELILMTWDNTSNYDLFKELGQDPSWLGFTEWGDWFQPFKYPRWIWPVQIESISGNTITLKQPLRASTAAVYNVALWKNEKNAYVTEVGIEDLTIVLDGDADGQTYDLGWNGLYLVRAFNCWVKDVEVLNGNNGFHVSASKNLTLRGTEVTGDRWVHHPYTARCMAADILFEDFTIDVTEDSTGGTHGLNAEFLASGNVWSKGTMNRGTFDTHRGMPFDMLRSEITLRNEDNSNPGGATKAGPYALSRMVHWNIDVVNNDRPDVDGQPQAGLYVAQPEVHSFGAIVGVKGAPLSLLGAWESTQGNVMPIGNKDVLVADLGSTPGITNLYDAQMNLRRTTEKAVYLTRPTYPFIRHGAPITLEADGYAGTSNITSVTFYVDGVAVHTDSSAPFTHSWNPDMGEYDLNLSMLDSTGTTTWATQEETVTVGVVNDWDNTSGSLNFVGAGWDQNLSASYWLGGSVAETRSNGDYVEFSFTGTRFKFYTSGGISQSVRYDLEINGSLVVDSLDIRRDAGVGYVAYDTGWMPEGDYTIRISNRDRLYIDRVVSYATSLSAPTNSIPSATLTSDVTVGEGPLTVAFDASGSSDPDPSDTLAFSWDFGDGNTAGNVTAVNHTYANPGSYTATVSVTDGSATATDSISIIVTQQGTTNSIPSATLTSDVTVGEGPLTVAFDASGSSDPDPSDTLAFSWDFGDGNTAGNVTAVNHTYANPGSYTATVSVTDGSATATDSISIIVTQQGTGGGEGVLLVHEQFLTSDYTVDVTVENQNGGTGFDTAWTRLAGLASHVDYQPRTSGLSYSNLNTAGGSLEHFRNSGSPDEKRVIHSFDALTPITVSGSTQMYIGFLFEVSSGADFKWIYAGDSNRDSVLTVDAAGNASFTGAGNSGTTIPLGPIQSGTNMFLLRATDATSGSPNDDFYDELEVWLNPDLQNLGTADGSGYGIISKFNGGDTDVMPDEYILGGSLDSGESFKFDEFFVTDDLSTVLSGGVVDPIQAWRTLHFGADVNTPALEATLWGDEADPNENGLPNLLEFLFGTDPVNPSVSPLTAVGPPAAGEFVVQYTRRIDRGNRDLVPEWSGDLLNPWSTAGITESVASSDGILETIEASLDTTELDGTFVRVRSSSN